MIEQRLGKLETQMAGVANSLGDIKLTLAEMRGQLMQMPKATDYAALRQDIGRLEGRINALPTWWMLMGAMIATWSAGAAILRYLAQ